MTHRILSALVLIVAVPALAGCGMQDGADRVSSNQANAPSSVPEPGTIRVQMHGSMLNMIGVSSTH